MVKTHVSCTVISYQVLTDNYKRTKSQWIAHLSFIQTSNLWVSIGNTGHVLGDLTGGLFFVHRAIIRTNFNMVHIPNAKALERVL